MKERIDIWLIDLLKRVRIPNAIIDYAVEIMYLTAIFIFATLVYFVAKQLLIRYVKKAKGNVKTKQDQLLLNSKCAHKLLNLVPAILIFAMTGLTPLIKQYLELILVIYISFMAVSALSAFLDIVNEIYEKKFYQLKQRPIRGFIKIIKVFLFLIAVVIVISRLLGQSPIIILSGLGAISAITLLIFRDAILGLVAGVQIATNDLVRIGDWIEMPKYGADGDVIAISITVVKVRNFDNTITTLPAYALVSDSFKNWRGMQSLGGRRIKRAINLDMSSIGFCSEEQLAEFSKIEYLKNYLATRQKEIKKYNESRNIDISCPVNGRRLTNIGVFREYIKEYLKNHPHIHKNMISMVRQLEPGKDGVPMEVYAFTNDTKWQNYEGIMADVFDHLFAVVPYFGLRIFQEPSGNDIKTLKG